MRCSALRGGTWTPWVLPSRPNSPVIVGCTGSCYRKSFQRNNKPKSMPSINVTVFDSTENKRVPVELPDDAPSNKLIAVLVDKMKLPKTGPDGAPLSYKFHHKNTGKQVQD